MAVRNVLLCFAIVPLLITSVIGKTDKDLVNSIEDIEDGSILSTSSASVTRVIDFSERVALKNWEERSDTALNSDGTSKWDGVWHNTTDATGGLFFFYVSPGSSNPTAGARKIGTWDLSSRKSIKIRFLTLGYPLKFRFICRTNDKNGITDPMYENRFRALNSTKWQRVTLPFDGFVSSIQGVIRNELNFDTSKITSVGIAAYGGIGISSMFIKDIVAV